jgi:sensor histidine kinase YesM
MFKFINQMLHRHLAAKLLCGFILIFTHLNHAYCKNNDSPIIIIKSFSVNNEEQKYVKNAKLNPAQNNIQITYEAIDLTFSGAIEYAYRLNNNKNWNTTNATTLTFPGLKAGMYNFSIKAKTETSSWSNIEYISFNIAKPYYSQTWFILVMSSILIISTSFLIYYRNKKYLEKERNELIQQQKFNEMENQAKQAMMNPHFVFNALNSIQHYMLENNKEMANRYLTKFSRLIRMNLDLSIKSNVSLEEELEKLKLYLEIEQLRFGEKLVFDFEIDDELETDIIQIPSMILQPFVENAIWHGIMPSHRNGHIQIKAESLLKDSILQIKIIDNGIGITNAKKLVKNKTHKSLGLQITKDRIMLFGKQYNIICQILTEDKEDSSGTVVTIKIPLINLESDEFKYNRN